MDSVVLNSKLFFPFGSLQGVQVHFGNIGFCQMQAVENCIITILVLLTCAVRWRDDDRLNVGLKFCLG